MNRVAITGAGVVSPIGSTLSDFHASLEAGRSGIARLSPETVGGSGVEVGAYHFFTLCRTGADQAANFLRVVPSAEADLPPAVDLEFPNNCSFRPSVESVQRELTPFVELPNIRSVG